MIPLGADFARPGSSYRLRVNRVERGTGDLLTLHGRVVTREGRPARMGSEGWREVTTRAALILVPPAPRRPNPGQRELLAAIGRGEVADRHHLHCGWATRWHTVNGRPVSSGGRGGGMGRNVTGRVAALVRAGWAERCDAPNKFDDQPYRLTEAGRAALAG